MSMLSTSMTQDSAKQKYNKQRIIFLDEPTTGLDPVTKRAVWKTIEEAKQNKVIILTTHSMEEANRSHLSGGHNSDIL